MKKNELKEETRVITVDGPGSILSLTRKGGECYPNTHVPVKLDKEVSFLGQSHTSLCYAYKLLKKEA